MQETVLDKLKDPRRVLTYVHWRYRDTRQFFRNCDAYLTIRRERRRPHTPARHGRPEQVVLSLASYRPRFRWLHLTLECLLRQSVRPDRIIVWVSGADLPLVTPRLKAFEARGVEYRVTHENFRSFNKIIPALSTFPEAVIVTVDDDMYYRSTMLEELLQQWSGDPKEIVCHYGVRIAVDAAGRQRPFKTWGEVRGPLFPAYDMMPYGFGGVLYPPHALPPQTLDVATFRRLCPSGDDIWLYWMARMNGCVYRKVTDDTAVLEWPFSQAVGLKHDNMSSQNQQQISRMVEAFGWPSLDGP